MCPPSPPSAKLPEHDPVTAEIVIIQATTTIEADEDEDHGYQTVEHNALDASLHSSVRDYNFEYGRRCHKYKEGYYIFPKDESEQGRDDMKHAMIVSLGG